MNLVDQVSIAKLQSKAKRSSRRAMSSAPLSC